MATDLSPQETPRPIVNLFFLIDTSVSMKGIKIGQVNESMSNVIPIINEISQNNPDAQIKISVLLFSAGAEWLYEEPKKPEHFLWKDVSADGKATSLGEACYKLNKKLSRKEGGFLAVSNNYAPVIILMSDGDPTDDFKTGITKLKHNKWFNLALKFAIAIGDDCNIDNLVQFTGNSESVIAVHDIRDLKTAIRLVTVTASQIGSQSSIIDDSDNSTDEADSKTEGTKQETLNAKIHDQIDDMPGVDSIDPSMYKGEFDDM
jgi:uncharacterized protein YegL